MNNNPPPTARRNMSKQIDTMQKIGLENEVNLCNSCCSVYPNCEAKNIIFGTGKGNDNIAACSSYEAITFRHPKDRGQKL